MSVVDSPANPALVDSRRLDGFVDRADGAPARLELAVEGIRCAGCMVKIETAVDALPGVTKARLNFSTRRLAVEWTEAGLTAGDIVRAVEDAGFRAYPFDPGALEAAEDLEARHLLRCLAVAAFASMNIMLLSVSVWSGNVSDITTETRDLFHWVSALIALPTAAYAGQPFFRSAIRALKAGQLNMDVPISLGVLLALGMSVAQTLLSRHHAYFDSAVMLLFFLLIGRYLDQSMRRRTRAMAQNLAALKADRALLMANNGSVSEVPVSQVGEGDLVFVPAGERLAVDGVVEMGTGEVDQSFVTGETASHPVEPGTTVYAGSLNLGAALTLRVTAAQSGTLIDEVQGLLDRALEARHRYVDLADRAAKLYAPMVHTLAAATVIGWLLLGAGWEFSIVTAIAVLIITCPCALGLAVPAVQVVASGALFKSGVLLNAGNALERFAEVDTVVFDKTGTLTLPEPEIANANALSGDDLALAGRLALSSRHPLSAALQPHAAPNCPVDGATETAGQGIVANVDDTDVRLGSAAFCGVTDVNLRAAHADRSLMWFRRGDDAPVAIEIAQALRCDATEVVADLMSRDIRVEILSGDRDGPVAEAADQLGVADWQAGLSPKDKIAHVERLAAEGRKVMMVGDGLNDAPALAAAHVSLSPVTAVHLSQAASDAVFLGVSLKPVTTVLTVSRRARSIMGQNLGLATIYNMIAVPIAVMGFVTPLIAALAMSGSSIIVTLNALRARPAGRPRETAA
ncbi:MAG: heavy metal translocating P-type ATPase [Pseudomonadota bacterium]